MSASLDLRSNDTTFSSRANPRKILIVSEHASALFGGEAALPLHYFRVMRKMGIDVRMITHDRVKPELQQTFSADLHRIHFIRDNAAHKLLWRVGRWLPARVSYFTTGFLSRTITQVLQRRLARRLVREHEIDLVHQPMPVSPREPSLMHAVGVPVVIGPLNGNMHYPPAFRSPSSRWKHSFERVARHIANGLNLLFPGKLKAAAILIANERTRAALPESLRDKAIILVENGVDLAVWEAHRQLSPAASADGALHVVFMGRLVDWKAVDLLLRAFEIARRSASISLTILGDGPCGDDLRRLSVELGIKGNVLREAGRVYFAGWQSQSECAAHLRLSHALALPSLSECGGAVVLEAMSCGLPVIATAWGGPLDYLDESTGMLIPPTSREDLIDGLCRSMLELAASPVLRERMGTAARKRIESDFDWDRKVEQMLAIYENALAPKAS